MAIEMAIETEVAPDEEIPDELTQVEVILVDEIQEVLIDELAVDETQEVLTVVLLIDEQILDEVLIDEEILDEVLIDEEIQVLVIDELTEFDDEVAIIVETLSLGTESNVMTVTI